MCAIMFVTVIVIAIVRVCLKGKPKEENAMLGVPFFDARPNARLN